MGAWQARLPSVIYTLIALGLLYWLGKRWFDRAVAITAVSLLLITSTDPFVSPIFMGRQELPEPLIMLACLLGGYMCLSLALAEGRWRLVTLPSSDRVICAGPDCQGATSAVLDRFVDAALDRDSGCPAMVEALSCWR